jgi:hypothetical protein
MGRKSAQSRVSGLRYMDGHCFYSAFCRQRYLGSGDAAAWLTLKRQNWQVASTLSVKPERQT